MAGEEDVRMALGATALAVTVAVTVALVAAIALSRRAAPLASAVPAAVAVDGVAAVEMQDVQTLVFGDAPALPADAQPLIDRVADALRAQPGRQVFVGAWSLPEADAALALPAAQARAQAVAHALEADGVARSQIVVEPVQPAWPGTGDQRRVELRVR